MTTRRDDETKPVLNTKVSRREHDRFVAIALRFGTTAYALLQDIVYRFNERFLADDAGLAELYATRRRLESEMDRRFEDLLAEQSKVRPAATAATRSAGADPGSGQDDVATALKRFVATANMTGIPAAIAEARDLDDNTRVRLQTRLAMDLPELWHQVRPYISGKLKVNPPGNSEVYSPAYGEGEP